MMGLVDSILMIK